MHVRGTEWYLEHSLLKRKFLLAFLRAQPLESDRLRYEAQLCHF